MFLAFAALLGAIQVTEARIGIDLESGGASVTAEYQFAAGVVDLSFDAIRWPAQSITLRDAAEFSVRDLGGLIRVAPHSMDGERYRLVYDVIGNASRIPLFIPNMPTVPGVSSVTITVSNVGSAVLLPDAFPRFTRERSGLLVGHPANLPSFVFMPQESRWSRAKAADAIVLMLLVAASGVWVARRVRNAR